MIFIEDSSNCDLPPKQGRIPPYATRAMTFPFMAVDSLANFVTIMISAGNASTEESIRVFIYSKATTLLRCNLPG